MNINDLSFCTEISDDQASTINGGYIDYNPYLDLPIYTTPICTTTEITPSYPWWEPTDFSGYLGLF